MTALAASCLGVSLQHLATMTLTDSGGCLPGVGLDLGEPVEEDLLQELALFLPDCGGARQAAGFASGGEHQHSSGMHSPEISSISPAKW